MSKPLVSVIIPLYNSELYIEECINSVIAQTWPNIEVIVIDDGSTDNSLSKVKALNNNSIKLFSQKNKGASAARNKGLRESKGEFIQFLDADDIISKEKINLQVLALQKKPNYLAICSTIHFLNDELKKGILSEYEESFLNNSDNPINFLIRLWGGYDNNGSMIQPNAWLTPRSIIDSVGFWNENLNLDDDGEYFARVILKSSGIIKVENAFNFYRKFSKVGNLSSIRNISALKSSYSSIKAKEQLLLEVTQSDDAKFAIARQFISLAVEAYPKHKSLSKRIEQDIKELGNYKYTPISGGPIIQKLSNIFGWKLARLSQFGYNKFRKKLAKHKF